MRFSKIESNKLSTDMSLTKWKQTNSAIFSALFFISKVRFKPCWVMQATIIICRIKNLWQYLPWTLSFSFTYTNVKENFFEVNAATFCWYFLGPFNNYVDKMRGGGGQKNVCFCPRSEYKNCPRIGLTNGKIMSTQLLNAL